MITAILLAADAAPAPARFADLPGIAVTYYDVAGRDVPEIHKVVTRLAPRDPVTGRVTPATSRWTVGFAVRSNTIGKSCTVTSVTLTFRGSAVMPRLAPDKERPAPVLAAWNAYAAALEARQAAQLGFAYARLPEIEKAIVGGRCDRAEAAAAAALARIGEQQRKASAADTAKQPVLELPKD
jgi:predicted secreted Zn-dependent protease